MVGWIILLVIVALVLGAVVWIVVERADERKRIAQKHRLSLYETNERIPLREPTARARPAAHGTPIFDELPAPSAPVRRDAPSFRELGRDLEPEPDSSVQMRFVKVPDGEMLLTTPPFALRAAIMSGRQAKFAASLMRRLPPWLVVCPKVRLDTILSPTPPDGRDPADWRDWRRRVRVRSIDVLLVDKRGWRPVLAIVFDPERGGTASKIAGGKDKIIDEVLIGVGLPMVRVRGHFKEDWSAIRPYVDQAVVGAAARAPAAAGPSAFMGGHGSSGDTGHWDASVAATLLRLDDFDDPDETKTGSQTGNGILGPNS